MSAPILPRWVADEMLGRLARYLRFLGHDTLYTRGLSDTEIAQRAVDEGRVLLTRDRSLSERVPGALRVRSAIIGEQLREVRAAFPRFAYALTFDRCPECNEPLTGWSVPMGEPWPPDVPKERVLAGLAVYACRACGRRYWDGSHTDRIREKVADWLGAPAP